jgi:hypothetical protein
MAGRDGPLLPPRQLSLLDFRLGVKRAPPDVDRAVIEAQVEARRQARLQREEAAKSAADAAKRPVGRPPKPRPDATRCVLVNGGLAFRKRKEKSRNSKGRPQKKLKRKIFGALRYIASSVHPHTFYNPNLP